MDAKTIKGTSLDVINDSILVIDNHIKSKTCFVRKSSVKKVMGKNNYFTHMTTRTGPKLEDSALFFMHEDVIIRLLLLNEVFPYLFEDLKLLPTSQCLNFIVGKEMTPYLIHLIKAKLDLISRINYSCMKSNVNHQKEA